MKERGFRYGENNRGFGMVTLPREIDGAPFVVMLNAGLLHRAEPYRLNVLAGRKLADIGYICLRVDISGKGDTPARNGLVNRESVALDWRFIKKEIIRTYGNRNIIIMGLCSGADNAIKITAKEASVKGLILIDAVSFKDEYFNYRTLWGKISNPYKLIKSPITLYKRIIRHILPSTDPFVNASVFRDPPNETDMKECFEHLVAADGRVLAVFTSFALPYYNKKWQFCEAMGVHDLKQICDENFWPDTQHIFQVQQHRDRLVEKISEWGRNNFTLFKITPTNED